jgi:hypothetical protein
VGCVSYGLRATPSAAKAHDDSHPVCRRFLILIVARHLQRLMDNPQLGSFLNGLVWRVVPLASAYTLLASDRPLVMTNGLVKPTDHLALAIGPRKLFIAANTPETIASTRHDDLVGQMNDRVCKQARRYVFAVDERQRTFIDKRLGLQWPSSPVDGIV